MDDVDMTNELNQARETIRRLEAEVADLRDEVGMLRLQLDVLGTTDIVTGLPNLHGILDVVDAAVQRARRSNEPFGVMSVRFGGLVAVLDDHGEDAWQEALRHTGALVAAGLRRVDRVGRTEDHGFLAVLPKLDEAGAAAVTERIGAVVAGVPLEIDDDRITFEPAMSIVLCPEGDVADTAAILDRLYAVRDDATPESPVVNVLGR